MQPQVISYGEDRSTLYISVHGHLVKVDGGIEEAMLALMAFYHIFNYTFDKKVEHVLTFFWYAIGKEVPKCPKEVKKAIEIANSDSYTFKF